MELAAVFMSMSAVTLVDQEKVWAGWVQHLAYSASVLRSVAMFEYRADRIESRSEGTPPEISVLCIRLIYTKSSGGSGESGRLGSQQGRFSILVSHL